MKHLVLAPMTGLFVLLLLLLMVQLAGLGTIQQRVMPVMQAPASVNISEIDFSPTETSSVSEFDPVALPEPPMAQAEIPEVELESIFAEAEVELSLAEQMIPEIVPEMALEDLLEPLLSGSVVIPEPVMIKPVVPKKPVAKKNQPKPPAVVKQVIKKVAKKPPVKAVEAAKKTRISKSTSLKASAIEATSSSSSKKSSQAVNSGGVSSKPISRVRPKYPKRARRRGIEGEVVISFLVNANGSVDRDSLSITSARPAKVFNKTVLKAVARWKFSKAARAYRNTQRLVFKLDK